MTYHQLEVSDFGGIGHAYGSIMHCIVAALYYRHIRSEKSVTMEVMLNADANLASD